MPFDTPPYMGGVLPTSMGSNCMKQASSIRRVSLAAMLLCALASAHAQSKESLSDAERAKRDAEKVFSFIKFSTVKPAAASAAAAAPVKAVVPAPKPAVAPVVAAVTSTASAASSPMPVQSVAASDAAMPEGATAAMSAPVTAAAPAATTVPAAAAVVAPTAVGLAAPSAAAAAPATQPEPEAEEVPLKLIAYTAPEMTAQVVQAMPSNEVVVPVRFVVDADGKVISARATGNVPRRVAASAVKAVQQWRFEPLPAQREVDVDVSFKLAD